MLAGLAGLAARERLAALPGTRSDAGLATSRSVPGAAHGVQNSTPKVTGTVLMVVASISPACVQAF